MLDCLNDDDKAILNDIAWKQILPIEKMVKYITDKYGDQVTPEQAKVEAEDILNRAGAEAGFITPYSKC